MEQKMKTAEMRNIIGNLRTNSRNPLKKITNGRIDKYAKWVVSTKKGNIVKRNISIPYFQTMGFPLIITYKIESKAKPIKTINDIHVNNCYRINGKSLYLIEAIFSQAYEVEDYEDIIKEESENFTKYYIVKDIVREGFIPK